VTPALDLWCAYLGRIDGRFREVVLTEFGHDPALARGLEAQSARPASTHRLLSETDEALEFCEDRLLTEVTGASNGKERVGLEDFELCSGLSAEQIRALREALTVQRYSEGELIVRDGDPATDVYFLVEGRVSVVTNLPSGATRRLTTCAPGMLFGDMAIVERRPRSATVRADAAVECYALSLDNFDRLTTTRPDLKAALLENFARNLSRRVRRMTNEVTALSG
jgi:CRP-like cAMP-binding protein